MDRPILFSGPMVRAILEGRKTQTRRVLKAPYDRFNHEARKAGVTDLDPSICPADWKIPYAPGARLYVRESWRTLHNWDCLKPRQIADDPSKVTFEADPENRNPLWAFGKLRPGIHMPRWASRLTLVVTDVRVQRVQDISEEDAIAEGIVFCLDPDLTYALDGWHWDRAEAEKRPIGMQKNARRAFRDLWDSINAKRGFAWDDSPWVVAVTFTPHKINIDQMPQPNGGTDGQA